jgi:hypothetical protein
MGVNGSQDLMALDFRFGPSGDIEPPEDSNCQVSNLKSVFEMSLQFPLIFERNSNQSPW